MMRAAALTLSVLTVAGAGGLARAATAAPAGTAATLETQHVTHAGEGSAGTRRLHRNGCHQSENSGSPGGGDRVRDSEVGCVHAATYAPMFADLDALMARGALVPEEKPAGGGAKGKASDTVGDAFQSARSVVIDAKGRRLVPASPAAAKDLAAIVGREPTLDFWYVSPPKPPHGTGAQLAVVSARKGSRMLQASLVATGSWWCHLTVPEAGARAATFGAAPKPLVAADATAILGRVLAGVTERSLADGEAKAGGTGDDALSVEAAVGAGPRTPVRDRAAAAAAAKRFSDELAPRAAACKL